MGEFLHCNRYLTMLQTSCKNRWIVFLCNVLCSCLNISAILLIFVTLKQIQKTSLLCFIQDRYLECLLASSNHRLEQIHGYIHIYSFFFLTLQGRGPSSAQLQSWIQHFLQQLYPSFFELLLILVITFPSLCHHHLPYAFDSSDRTLKNPVLFPITVNILFKVMIIYLFSPINYSARNILTRVLLQYFYCLLMISLVGIAFGLLFC